MITGLELVDIWKKLKNNEPGHTFHHHAGSSRLDRIYASQMFADNFTSICLQPVLISDHQSIQSSFKCNLDLSQATKSSASLWKLNTLILSEEVFQNQITHFILQSSRHPLRERNVANWWESVLKPGIKRIIRHASKRSHKLIPLIGLPSRSWENTQSHGRRAHSEVLGSLLAVLMAQKQKKQTYSMLTVPKITFVSVASRRSLPPMAEFLPPKRMLLLNNE